MSLDTSGTFDGGNEFDKDKKPEVEFFTQKETTETEMVKVPVEIFEEIDLDLENVDTDTDGLKEYMFDTYSEIAEEIAELSEEESDSKNHILVEVSDLEDLKERISEYSIVLDDDIDEMKEQVERIESNKEIAQECLANAEKWIDKILDQKEEEQ